VRGYAAPVQNLEFFKPTGTCASGKPQNFSKSAPVQNLHKPKKLVVPPRQHYNPQNLVSQVRNHRLIQPDAFASTKAKSPQFDEIGGFWGKVRLNVR
jgi:hypothetical protein